MRNKPNPTLTEKQQTVLDNMLRLNVDRGALVNYLHPIVWGHFRYIDVKLRQSLVHKWIEVLIVKQQAKIMQENIPTPDYKFGHWVTFTYLLKRKVVHLGSCYEFTKLSQIDRSPYLYWSMFQAKAHKEHTRGIFLGYRTLNNGYYEYKNDCPGSLKSDFRIKSALVSVNSRSNPIRVAVQGMRRLYDD